MTVCSKSNRGFHLGFFRERSVNYILSRECKASLESYHILTHFQTHNNKGIKMMARDRIKPGVD